MGDHGVVTKGTDGEGASRQVLLCFDGSDGAAHAIVAAGTALAEKRAVVLTVWEPLATWAPYDPVTILSAPFAKAASKRMDLDEIARGVAEEQLKRGVSLAAEAGFTAEGRAVEGKAWRTICDVADDLDAGTIVLGARGLSRVESMLLGSVSLAVVLHAARPVLVVPPIAAAPPASQ
jgi:nucleotide-binding universal stress UspA family protein